MKVFLRLIRFPNLLIVALTQWLLAACLLWPPLLAATIPPLLDGLHFALLVFTTMLIAAGGYIINDIYDLEIDAINKPHRQVVGKHYSLTFSWQLYFGLLLGGAVLAFYLAMHIHHLALFAIYPVACFLLWWYAVQLKRTLLAGNITVAVFCAFVAGIVWFAEREAFAGLWSIAPEQGNRTAWLLTSYLLFAFFSTMYREIIKDMEDRKGDADFGAKTLPVVFGILSAKRWALFFGLLLALLMLLLAYDFYSFAAWIGLLVLMVFAWLPLLYSFWKLGKATEIREYHQLSQLAKFIMFSGILLLPILQFINHVQ